MLKLPSKQSGISLVELMVGIAISLILLAGVLTLVLRVSTSGAKSVTSTRLNQQMRATLDYVTKEIQRAGYVNWYEAWDANGDGILNDDINGDGDVDVRDFYISAVPRMDLFGSVTLWQFPTPGTATGTPATCTTDCDCVLYSYDLNKDGLQGVGGGTTGTGQNTANFELFGIRWNGDAVEVRTSGDTQDCTSGSWADITDDDVRITRLGVSQRFWVGSLGTSISTGTDSTVYALAGTGAWDDQYRNACPPRADDGSGPMGMGNSTLCLDRRKFDIVLQGQLAKDTDVRVDLRSDVKIRNDFLDALP